MVDWADGEPLTPFPKHMEMLDETSLKTDLYFSTKLERKKEFLQESERKVLPHSSECSGSPVVLRDNWADIHTMD